VWVPLRLNLLVAPSSHIHTFTHSHNHTFTQSHIHTITHSHNHTITQSHIHTFTHSHNHTFTQSHIYTITLSRNHIFTQSHIHAEATVCTNNILLLTHFAPYVRHVWLPTSHYPFYKHFSANHFKAHRCRRLFDLTHARMQALPYIAYIAPSTLTRTDAGISLHCTCDHFDAHGCRHSLTLHL